MSWDSNLGLNLQSHPTRTDFFITQDPTRVFLRPLHMRWELSSPHKSMNCSGNHLKKGTQDCLELEMKFNTLAIHVMERKHPDLRVAFRYRWGIRQTLCNVAPWNPQDGLHSREVPGTGPRGRESGAHASWLDPQAQQAALWGAGTTPHPRARPGKSGFLQFPDSPYLVLSSCFPTCWQEGFSVLLPLMFTQKLPPWHHVTWPGMTQSNVWGGNKKLD